MRIAVVGPGALGCLFAARLAKFSAHEVFLLDRDKERAAFLSSKGLTLIEGPQSFSIRVPVFVHPEEIDKVDLFLLCVKSQSVASAIERLKVVSSPDNLLIALQNGIAHHNLLQDGYSGSWAIGVTAHGAALEGKGVVRHGGNGATTIGTVDPRLFGSLLLDNAVRALCEAGFHTSLAANIESHVWQKFIVNVGINALTVIFDCPNGHLLHIKEARRRMGLAVEEAARVAAVKGIEIGQDPIGTAEKICQATSINISSMLQDIRRCKKTEIDAINGALVVEAQTLGIEVPENERLLREVKKIEERCLSIGPS